MNVAPKPENLGRCYELSALRVAFGPDGPVPPFAAYEDATLVHGTIQGFGHPPLPHAWVVEPNGDVWEPACGRSFPAEFFNLFFNPTVRVTYTPAEARANMMASQHYGAWDIDTEMAS